MVDSSGEPDEVIETVQPLKVESSDDGSTGDEPQAGVKPVEKDLPSTPPAPATISDSSPIRPEAADRLRVKPAKSGKPDFEAFITEFEAIVSGEPSKGSVGTLLKVLRTGYTSDLTSGHLDSVFGLLQGWRESSRLALTLYMETRKKNSSTLMRSLRNRLVSHAQATTEYPNARDEGEGREEERAEALLSWLEAQLNASCSGGKAEADNPDQTRVRWILLALMEEPAAIVRNKAIHGLLECLARWGESDEASHPELEFAQEVVGMFSTEKMDYPRIRAAVRASHAARLHEQQSRRELQRTKALLDQLRSRSDDLSRIAADLEHKLLESRARLDELERLGELTNRQLADERRERLLDQEHWQSQSDHRINKLVSDVRTRLGHEINEAKISLCQEPPNVRMALDRLSRIEKALEKLKDD